MPPEIAALCERHLGARPLVHEAVRDVGTLLQSLIDDLLGADELAAALALVRGDADLGAGVDDAVAQGVGAEAGEDDGVQGADTCAGEEGDDCFWNHGEVDGDGVTLLHAHLLQHPRELADFAEELAVADGSALALLVCLVDDGGLVGVLGGVSVDAVV